MRPCWQGAERRLCRSGPPYTGVNLTPATIAFTTLFVPRGRRRLRAGRWAVFRLSVSSLRLLLLCVAGTSNITLSQRKSEDDIRNYSYWGQAMTDSSPLTSAKRLGTGLAFIIFPLVFLFAFVTHPNLLNPHFLGPEELILRARNASLLHFGHALVTLNTALLVVVALHFMTKLEHTRAAWAGFIGGLLAILGALMLAADKGALCLTMSAFDSLSDYEFTQMMPGLLALFAKKGWVVLVWGILLLPIGFGIQAIALIATRSIPRWQSILFLVGVLFIGTPDGVEIVNLTASVMLTAAFIPYGIQIINEKSGGGVTPQRTFN